MTDWPAILTARLSIAHVESADLPALLTVRTSNPERLLLTEGSQGEPGLFTLEMFERDLMIADMDPARAMLAIRLRDSDTLVGMADVLLEHPEDGHPPGTWSGDAPGIAHRARHAIGPRSSALPRLSGRRNGSGLPGACGLHTGLR